jgi:hypothetical protein
MAEQDIEKLRTRLAARLEATARREEELGREGFLALPARIQNRMSVLQIEAQPKGQSREALVAAQQNLDSYNSLLDDAFNLVAQLDGMKGRAAAASKRRASRLGLGTTVGLILMVGAGSAYRSAKQEKADTCRQASPCREIGLCGAALRLEGSVGLECRALDAADCEASQGCLKLGQCQVVDGGCAAASDEDCRKIARCASDGWCTQVEGRCIAGTTQDCRRIEACTQRGACTPINEVCVAGSDADCRQSELCRTGGACVEVDNKCVPPPDWQGDAGADAGGR